MAGDWIKARVDLHEQPEVIGLSGRLKIDVDAVVGKLVRLWGWADRVTIDGVIDHVGGAFIDRLTDKRGFAEALVAVRWLEITANGIVIPHFDRHNGESAKRRAMNTERQRQLRDKPSPKCRTKSATEARQPRDETRDQRREEKRREEKEGEPPTPSPDSPSPIPSELDTHRFRESWAEWLAMRKRIKKPASAESAGKMLKRLVPFGEEWAFNRVEDGIANEWQGLVFSEDKPGEQPRNRQPVGSDNRSRIRANPGKYAGHGRVVDGSLPVAAEDDPRGDSDAIGAA